MFHGYGGFGGGFVSGPVFGGAVYGGPMVYGGGFRHSRRPMGFYGGWHGFQSHWAGYMVSTRTLSRHTRV
jgi:hypothetical protein